MKKIILFAGILYSSLTFSQVGVNTDNPQGSFHVDGGKDNAGTGVPSILQQTNDLIVTAAGNVGIGTVLPNTNAALDINSSTKGVKLPSLALTATTSPSPLTSHVSGMLIYNTATAGTAPSNVVPGLYTNDGTQWILLQTPTSSNFDVPAGSVFYRASSIVPVGYLECNGAAVSRTAYATLFSIIGIIYGAGDGSTTFNLPDLRGEFIRGWDHSKGTDVSRAIGTFQNHSIQNHEHDLPTNTSPVGSGRAAMIDDTGVNTQGNASLQTGRYFSYANGPSGNYTIETRPRNFAMMPIIKY